jgi:hypothetical protein
LSGKIVPRVTSFTLPPVEGEAPAIQDIFRLLCADENRNSLIAEDILGAYRKGRECLVLSERL